MEQFNTIPTSGNWSDIAGILDANFLRCYTALVQSESLVGLSGSNFQGIYTSASELPEMTSSGWALVGSSLSALTLYVYNTGSSEWGALNSTTYNFMDFSEFQTQLDALSSQVATIGSNLDSLSVTFDVRDVVFDTQGYINSIGNILSFENATATSEYYPINDNIDYKVTLRAIYDVNVFCYYDRDKNFISGYKNNSGEDVVSESVKSLLALPNNAVYIRFSSFIKYTTIQPSAIYTISPFLIESDKEEILDKIQATKDLLQADIDTQGLEIAELDKNKNWYYFGRNYVDGEYFSIVDGSIAKSTNYIRSQLIDVTYFKKLYWTGISYFTYILFFDANKALLSYSEEKTSNEMTIADGVRYVGFNLKKDDASYLAGIGDTYIYFDPILGNEVSALSSLVSSASKNGVFKVREEEVDVAEEFEGAYINNKGVQVAFSNINWIVRKYNVEGGSTYRVVANIQYSNSLFAIYDAEDNLLLFKKTSISEAYDFDDVVMMPASASYIKVCYNKSYKVGGLYYNEITKAELKWKGKKWVVVGDSLTEVNVRTTMHYHDYIAEETGISVVNMGLSGSGYKKREDTSHAFYNRVNNIPLDADVITIFGSGNDCGSNYQIGNVSDTTTDTLCGCINTTLETIFTKYIEAGKIPVIGVVTPTPWQYSMPSTNSYMETYADAIIECCKAKSIPCLDLYRCSNLRPDNETFRTLAYSKDEGRGVHPDENGHKIIAPKFKEFLESLLP